MAGITGIGSGVDINSIVTALVNAERGPKQAQLDRLEKVTTSRISALGTLRSSVSDLNTALDGLNSLSAFRKQSVSSSNSSVLTASSSATLAPAKFNLQVQQLASSSKVALQSVAGGAAATFNSGTLTVSAGDKSIDVTVAAGKNTLGDIRDAINTAGQNLGFSASIVSDASGARLVLASNVTGEGADLRVAVSEDGVTSGSNSLTGQAFKPVAGLGLPNIVAGAAGTFKSGSLTIAAGAQSLNLSIADNASLTDIQDAINAGGVGKGISASIQSDASGARLLISSSNGADIAVTATDAGGGADTGGQSLAALNPPAGSKASYLAPSASSGKGGVINTAQSAKLSVDGLQVTKSSNTIDDVINGVTLNLVSAQSADDIAAGKTVDVSITQDKNSTKNSLQKFVDAYNKLVKTSGELTAVVQVGQGKAPVTGPLLGDASVRGMLSGLRKELGHLAAEGDDIRALSELGITTQRDGTLALDATKLDTALSTNYDKVAGFLAGEGGLMGRLSAVLKPLSGNDGVLDSRVKNLQNTLNGVDKQRTALDLRIQQVQDRLLSQFNAMDSLVGQLKKTSEALTGQLASLPGVVKN